jgi:outer membrane murein-binding lipoprotein Lpp
MVPTMLKRVVVCAVLAVWVLGMSGCVKQSEYDAKVAEVKDLVEKSAKVGEKSLQLQKDLDAAKTEAEQAKKDADAKIKTLEQENAGLKEKALQVQTDLAAAKSEVEKAVQAKKDADAKVKGLEQEDAGLNDQKKAAEAKIKALEQEKADLQKQVSKPAEPKK